MDDHGELSPEQKESAVLMELIEELERLYPEEMRQEAERRGLAALAFDGLLKLLGSDDPLAREEARTAMNELGFGFLLPDTEPGVPDE